MKKILMCRIAWMKYYQGRANIDIPRSGSKYILENKTGGEIYNFKNINGKVFANFPYISYPGIHNLGAKKDDEFIDDVLLVFCAKHPVEGGIRVVGWYKKARIYSSWRIQNSHYYHGVAKYKDIHLIPEDDRIFRLPDTFGRSSLYYISTHPEKTSLQLKLEKYIANNGIVLNTKKNERKENKVGIRRQSDLDKKILVEQKAINVAKQFYGERYEKHNVLSVEKENKGWDLEVRTKKGNLRVEVKGLSGKDVVIELTPNEYKIFKQRNLNYQLFVVTEALSKHLQYRVYKYQGKGNLWVGSDSSILKIKTVQSARLFTE